MFKIKDKEVDIKFTFNSFKYLEDFSFKELDELQDKPFKIIRVVEDLVYAGVNNNPKKIVARDKAETIAHTLLEEYPMNEVIEGLINDMVESDFFKLLQK